jgi:[ribosomal protein S5]-alanine N-acetyltransferase
MFPIFETERLRLRELKKEDAQGIFACFSNDKVIQYYGQEKLETLQHAEQFVDVFSNNFIEKRGIRWGIERKEELGIIGTIGFHTWSPKHKRAEIGYEIHPDYWGRGYMSEAALRVLSYGFDEMDLTRVGAIVFLENEASSHLLMKTGFQQEGILRKYMVQNGIAHDTYVYSLLKDHFLKK